MNRVYGVRKYVTTIVVCVTVIALGFLGLILYLGIHGYRIDQLLLYVSQFLPPIVIGIFTLLKVKVVETNVKKIEEQTNGELQKQLQDQTEEIKSHVDSVVNEGNHNAN